MYSFRTISRLLITLSILPACADAELRYVDSLPAESGSGWDGVNGGTYSGAPGTGKGYSKIQDAVNAMSPGDIIFLRGGTYNETHIDLTPCRNGLPGSPNVMKSYPGEWAIVDSQYQDPTYFRPAVFWGTGSGGMSYWTFENMEITGGGDPTTPPRAAKAS